MSRRVVVPLSLLRKISKISKIILLQSFSKSRNKHHIPSLIGNHFPLTSWPWRGLFNTYLRLKKVPHINFLRPYGKQVKISRKQSFVVCFMQYIELWFRTWDATHLLHDASIDSFVI